MDADVDWAKIWKANSVDGILGTPIADSSHEFVCRWGNTGVPKSLNHHSPHESGYHFRWSITHLQTQISPDLKTGWWFGTCFYFSIILGMSSSQLTFIFFRGVEATTNQNSTYFIKIGGHKPDFSIFGAPEGHLARPFFGLRRWYFLGGMRLVSLALLPWLEAQETSSVMAQSWWGDHTPLVHSWCQCHGHWYGSIWINMD